MADRPKARLSRASLSRAFTQGGAPRSLYADRINQTLREGDVVLFKGKQLHDRGIRCFTSSEYNHVGLVVENGGELELFEASAVGVGCVPFEFYVNSYYWSHMSHMFHKVLTDSSPRPTPLVALFSRDSPRLAARARRW